jgi:hypothetical protein
MFSYNTNCVNSHSNSERNVCNNNDNNNVNCIYNGIYNNKYCGSTINIYSMKLSQKEVIPSNMSQYFRPLFMMLILGVGFFIKYFSKGV